MRAGHRTGQRPAGGRSVIFRSTAIVTMAALSLVGCGHYQANITPPSEAAGQLPAGGNPHFVLPEGAELSPTAEVTMPRALRSERLIRDEPRLDDPEGWVQLRFDVDETGQASNVRVVRASQQPLVKAARELLLSWEFRPATVDGTAVAFEDMEVVLGFADRISPGEAGRGAAIALGVVVLLPVMLAVSILGDPGTTFFHSK